MRNIIFILICFLSLLSSGQESHFSQFYNAPQSINPAFAGDAYFFRGGIISRLSTPIKGEAVVNTILHADLKFIGHNSGLGIVFYHHKEQMQHVKLQINYSYTQRLSDSDWIKAGIGFSVNQRRTGILGLSFPDQYDNNGLISNATSEPMLTEKSFFPSVRAGFAFYRKFVWVSFAGDYLNKPVENFAGTESTFETKITLAGGFFFPLYKNSSARRRFSLYGGIKPHSSIGPVFLLEKQGDFLAASNGIAFHLQPVYGSVNYRVEHSLDLTSKIYAYKAISIALGFRREEVSLAYSYDITTSKLSLSRRGSHELSAIYFFSIYKHDYKQHGLIPLPNQMIY